MPIADPCVNDLSQRSSAAQPVMRRTAAPHSANARLADASGTASPSRAQRPTIVYIAGYGRSGSTLLERVLNEHPAVVAAGEVMNLPWFLGRGQHCGCTHVLEACPVWGSICTHVARLIARVPHLRAIQRACESRTAVSGRLWWRASAAHAVYRELAETIFQPLAAQARAARPLVIDSSKTTRLTAWRPWALAAVAGYQVQMVHLVRDPRGCLWSNRRGSNHELERGQARRLPLAALRTTVGWRLAHAAAERFAAELPECYLRLRYEDLTCDPHRALAALGRFLDIDLAEQAERLAAGKPLEVAHQMSGNRLRSATRVVLAPDQEWHDRLHWTDQLWTRVTVGSRATRYGYR